jgi:superfamily II DNA or RNA helicase
MEDFLAEKLYIKNLSNVDKQNLVLFNNEVYLVGYDEVEINGVSFFRIPRYFYPSIASNIKDFTTIGEDIDIELKPGIKPLDEYQEHAINSIITNNNGLLCARVGFGKTYIASDSITKIKKKTLIVVHNASEDGLMDQWIDNIKKYTTCDDIGLIRADKFDAEHPVCFTTVQTLCSKIRRDDREFISKMYEANFGVTFYDECHISVGAPEFSESMKAIFSKRLYGLSATPFRTDGLSKLLDWNIGPEIYNDNILFTLPIFVGLIDIPMELGSYTKYLAFGSANALPSRYCNFLFKNVEYIKLLAAMIDMCLDAGRNPLILSSKIDMLYAIETCMKNKEHVTIVHATSKNKDYTKRCILATYGMFKMAMDVPHLDTLLFANPLTNKSGLIQAIGRVARRVYDKPNKNVLVIDISNSKYNVMMDMRKYRTYHYNFMSERSAKGLKLVNIQKIEDIKIMCEKLKY